MVWKKAKGIGISRLHTINLGTYFFLFFWGGKIKMKFVTRGHGITDYTLKKKDHEPT